MDGEELSRNVTRLMGANDAETARWEWHGLDPLETVATEPELKRRGIASDVDAARFQQVYFDAWPALYADAELRTALSVRSTAFNSRLFYLRRMAAVTDELHQAIMQQATPSGS